MKKKLYRQMEKYLEEYDRVLLIADERFRGYHINVDIPYKLLVLARQDTSPSEGEAFTLKIITDEECREFIHMYHMYEFSDSFLLLGTSRNYGGLLNMVDTGMMTGDEVVEALLQ